MVRPIFPRIDITREGEGTLAFDRRRIGMQPAQPVLPVAAYAASAAKDASVLLSGDPWHKHTLRHEI